MQQASTVACPECGLAVAPARLDLHLRNAHHLYQYRGARAPLAVTLTALTDALCRPGPDPDAYPLLERIARLEYGRQAPAFLASTLAAGLARLDAALLPGACRSLATLVASRRSITRALTAYLAADAAPAAQQLALALAARLPAPLDRRLVRAVRRLLGDRKLPEALQTEAAAALLRSTGPDGPRALSVLKAFVGRRPPARALTRLRRLTPLIGDAPALTRYCQHLAGRQRLRCPRCLLRLRRPEMVRHLWAEHRMVLYGDEPCEPWPLLERWLTTAVQRDNAALMERCREFARRLDPQEGPRRLQRLALARGQKDIEARRGLLAEAAERGASLCPHCYDFVLVPRDEPPRPMSVSGGRLASCGYRIEVHERGLFSWAEFETPYIPAQRVAGEARRWTSRGASLFLAGPVVLLALVCAFVNLGLPPVPIVFGLLLVAGALYAVGHFFWQPEAPADERAVDIAWSALAPRLHAEGFSLEDSAFLASLALASRKRGRPEARRAALDRLLPLTERVVGAGFGGARHLAALRGLALVDAARQGKDPVLLLVAELDSCFHGALPLAYADELVRDLVPDEWGRADLARLRVLVLESAFEAGFEVKNVIEAGETAPELGRLLGTDAPDELAQLRLLWSLRASRPWDREGSAETVFEIAADREASAVLARHPDLLLRHTLPPRFAAADGSRAALFICGRGVVFRDVVFPRPPRDLEVVARRGSERGYILIANGQRFRFTTDPDLVASRLEGWCRYLTDEFLPRVPEVHAWQSPDVTAVLRAWGTVHCPDCRRSLLPRLGEVGVPLD